MRVRSLVLFAAVVSGCCLLKPDRPGQPIPPSDKFLTYAGSEAEIVPGSYFVLFDDAFVPAAAVRGLADSLVAGTGGKVSFVLTESIRGFAAEGLADPWAYAVSTRQDVKLVRKDVRVAGKEIRGNPWGPPPWNLDRIDQRASFQQDRDYRYKTGRIGSGPQVPIYVVDNGVYKAHSEFSNGATTRVVDVVDATVPVGTPGFNRCVLNVPDAHHGTAIASIAAGKGLGITPTAIRNVKVLDRDPFGSSCTAGTTNQVVFGLDAAFSDMQNNGFTKAVFNLSLGWPVAEPVVAIQIVRLQDIGAVIVAAAGNENRDASTLTPANLPGVVAVGATSQADARWVFSAATGSNFGSTVALWAPGGNILGATWPTPAAPQLRDSFDGTSMAAPHVAGALALLWQQNPNMSATQVVAALRARATRNMLTMLGAGSPNALLYVGEDAPSPSQVRRLPQTGGDGFLRAVHWDGYPARRQVLLAGGDDAGPTPFAFATVGETALSNGPLTQGNVTPAVSSCTAISVSPSANFFGCMRPIAGGREAVVVATGPASIALPLWLASLGPASSIDDITYGYQFVSLGQVNERVYAVVTRPRAAPATGSEVVVFWLDTETGQQVGSLVLTAPGFQEDFHRGVEAVLLEVVSSTTSELVVATYSDPPGRDKTFVWKLDPVARSIVEWREVPPPSLAVDGMFATSLAVQAREDNGNGTIIPAEVFLSATVQVVDGGRRFPWAYIFRMNQDRVTVHSTIEVVKDSQITTLWSEGGDLFLCGSTTRTFAAGDLQGVPKPGANPDYDTFLGRSEGVVNTRHWVTTFNPTPPTNPTIENDIGFCHFDGSRAYLAGSDADGFFVVEYPVF